MKLIQMHLQICNQNIWIWMQPQDFYIWMCSWKIAFASSETFAFAFKCIDMHLLTSLLCSLVQIHAHYILLIAQLTKY